MSHYVVLIPAYKPDEKLITLVKELSSRNICMHIVDDGSGEQYTDIFEAVQAEGATVHRYELNKGKGGALKTGIADLLALDPQPTGIITADADGQHSPDDIEKIMYTMDERPDTLIIGGRHFVGNVPLRSKVGNGITRFVYFITTGNRIHDTQTGLRGLPAVLYSKLLSLKGNRYEYEMNMLLKIGTWGVKFYEMPIDTIYINDNETSHFNVFKDSWRIYKQILTFCASSVLSTGTDYALFILMPYIGIIDASLHIPYIGIFDVSLRYIFARTISATMNYLLNRHVVFKTGGRTSFLKYCVLALLVMGLGSVVVSLYESIGLPAIWAKIATDVPLFFVNYILQRKIVFHKKSIEK